MDMWFNPSETHKRRSYDFRKNNNVLLVFLIIIAVIVILFLKDIGDIKTITVEK